MGFPGPMSLSSLSTFAAKSAAFWALGARDRWRIPGMAALLPRTGTTPAEKNVRAPRNRTSEIGPHSHILRFIELLGAE